MPNRSYPRVSCRVVGGGHECTAACQYEGCCRVSWKGDVSPFNKLQIEHLSPVKASGRVGFEGSRVDDSRISELEGKLQDAQRRISELFSQLEIERKERTKLTDEVEIERKERTRLTDEVASLKARLDCAVPSKEQSVMGEILIPRPVGLLRDFDEIPIVDMSLPLEDISASIGRACREVGFFYVVNHGIPSRLSENAFSLARDFFSRPISQKMELSNTKSARGLRGYFRLGQENLNGKDGTRDLAQEGSALSSYKGDLKEGFDCGRELTRDKLSWRMCGDNQWPENFPDFRDGLLEYQAVLLILVEKILRAFASSLGMDPEYFVNKSRDPMCTLRLLHYPPQRAQDEQALKEQLGCGAHTDYGLCTLLNQDSIGGLQVRNGSKQWVQAKPIAGSFVVNIGDMMSRWTNGIYSSTVHRVLNVSEKERYSMPFFFNPDFDAIVKPLESCKREGEAAKFDTETASDILMGRYTEAFSHI